MTAIRWWRLIRCALSSGGDSSRRTIRPRPRCSKTRSSTSSATRKPTPSNAIPKQQFDTQVATVHQYEGTVKLDQGQLDNAKVQLAYCHITAPISGRVGLRLVDPGNIVQANGTSPLVVITQLQPITRDFHCRGRFSAANPAALRQGKKLAVDAFRPRADKKNWRREPSKRSTTKLTPTTGTVKLRAIFTNDDESLFPNQFVNARLLVDTLHDVTLVPNTVIQRNADRRVCLFVADQPNRRDAAHHRRHHRRQCFGSRRHGAGRRRRRG